MKVILPVVLALGLVTLQTTLGQQIVTSMTHDQTSIAPGQTTSESAFTKFDLDFPGGTPADLVAAIEAASGKPLNAVIPVEHAGVQLPPLKLRNVTARQIFQALTASSKKTIQYQKFTLMLQPQWHQAVESYGFRTQGDNRNGGNDTIWYFFYEKHISPPSPKACRYYQLESYLGDHSIDDITTAIQTGWEMLGKKEVPELSFHKETQLLIAVGDIADLKLIDDVLEQLAQALPPPPIPVAFPPEVSGRNEPK